LRWHKRSLTPASSLIKDTVFELRSKGKKLSVKRRREDIYQVTWTGYLSLIVTLIGNTPSGLGEKNRKKSPKKQNFDKTNHEREKLSSSRGCLARYNRVSRRKPRGEGGKSPLREQRPGLL